MHATRPASLHCPQCNGAVWRMRRKLGDRLASLFVPVFRYRCTSVSCGWEGLVRRAALLRTYDGRPLLDPSRNGGAAGGADQQPEPMTLHWR